MLRTVLDRLGFLLRDRQTTAGRLTNATLYGLNTLFIVLYIASTYSLPSPYPAAIRGGELVLATVFLAEFGIRVYSAEDRWAEVRNPYTVVDLVAILPVFILTSPDVGFLRGLHTLRIFRFLRLVVHEQQFLGKTLRVTTVRRLELSATIFLIFFIATGFIYAVEAGTNSAIHNFGDAFYYTVIAVSTVGFGDITPVTQAGRWVTVIAVLVGFVLIPWQASRLRNLSEPTAHSCPRCGHDVAEGDRYCRQCGRLLGASIADGGGQDGST